MKNNIVRLLVAGCTLAGIALCGENKVLVAEVPFAFYMGDKAMPAGEYSVEDMNHGQILTLRSATAAGRLTSWPVNSAKAEEAPRLVFHCYSGACFLNKVWTGYSGDGIALGPSKGEKELARDGHTAILAEIRLAAH